MQMPAKPCRLHDDDGRIDSAQTGASSGTASASAEQAGTGTRPSPSRNDTLVYIGEMSSILAQLSRQHRLATLNYLLELARMEADANAATRPSDAQARKSRRALARR
jgi:hypothetical protein